MARRHAATPASSRGWCALSGLAWALLALAAVGCSTERAADDVAAAARPSVLLVTIDTLRSDHLSAYGYARPTSPRIDAIAAEGVLFETAYAPASATGPSHASLFTARYPLAHGVVRNALPLDEKLPTIASLLGAGGYQTAAFVSSFPLASRFGFAHGFAHYDEDFAATDGTMESTRWQRARGDQGALDRRGEATVNAATAWLDRQRDGKPLFVWVHLFDPHAPYAPPAPFDTTFTSAQAPPHQRDIDLYDGEIRYADVQVGRLVDAFDRAARATASLVVITSDHGEGLWEHGYAGHNRDLFEEEVRVPLIMRWRDHIAPGRRVVEPVQLIDVLPTILAACALDAAPAGSVGLDLLRALGGAQPLAGDRAIYLTRPYFGERARKARPNQAGWGFGIRRGPWKLIEASKEGRLDLFDLQRDPDENTNVAAAHPVEATELATLVETWRAAASVGLRADALEVPRKVRRKLRALGYAE